jgi:hypothetical protein
MRRYSFALTVAVLLVATMTIGAAAVAARVSSGPQRDGTPNGGPNAPDKHFTASPFEFDPTHSGIVVGDWVRHLGLPDSQSDQRFGLLLSKNGMTTTNASAGVVFHGVKGIHVTELGYDLRMGGHCGAGAPRFNVVTTDEVTHFIGCASGTRTATSNPGWERVRFSPTSGTQAFPPISPSETVESIAIVFDEGTDTGPDHSGMVVLDNLDINGVLIGGPGDH